MNISDCFSFKGRANRKPYIVALIIYTFISQIAVSLIDVPPEKQEKIDALGKQLTAKEITATEYTAQVQEIMHDPLSLASIIGFLSFIIFLPFFVARLKDIDWSPYLALIIVVPVIFQIMGKGMGIILFLGLISFVLMVILAFKQGTAGDNQYGPDPLKTEADADQ